MAIPELYVTDVFKTGAVPEVYELVGGTTLNQIGTINGVGPNAGEGAPIASTDANLCNRVVEFRGEIYMMYLDASSDIQVLRYNRGTTLWTVAYTFGANPNSYTGLFVVNTGSDQRLFFAARVAGSGQIFYTDDGTSWTDTGVLSSVGANKFNSNPGIVFNNKLYMPYWDNGTFCWEIDPIALSITSVNVASSATTSDYAPSDLVVHDDRLLMLCPDDDTNGAVTQWALYEFTGSGFILNTQITSGGSWNNIATVGEGQCCLFKDPNNNNLIALCNGTGSSGTPDYGSTAFQLTPSGSVFTPTDITSSLIPSAYRPSARGASSIAAEDRWYCVVVNDTDPTTAEVFIFLSIGPAPGIGYSVYSYTDASTELASPVAGPGIAFAIPHFKSGGGLRINKGTGNQCAVESAGAVSGAYRLNYRVYGTIASQTVRLYYSIDQETPTIQGSIVAQTGGSGISGGNAVTGITGDDGSTLFTLDWDTISDGIPNGDAVNLLLDIT